MGSASSKAPEPPPPPQPALVPPPVIPNTGRLKRQTSQAEAAGLTLHQHCGGTSKALLRCMREHGLPPDPFALSAEDQAMQPCVAALRDFQRCGKESLASNNVTQAKCASEVSAARDACAQGHREWGPASRQCEKLEGVAMRCLGTKLKFTMSLSGGQPPPSAPPG